MVSPLRTLLAAGATLVLATGVAAADKAKTPGKKNVSKNYRDARRMVVFNYRRGEEPVDAMVRLEVDTTGDGKADTVEVYSARPEEVDQVPDRGKPDDLYDEGDEVNPVYDLIQSGTSWEEFEMPQRSHVLRREDGENGTHAIDDLVRRTVVYAAERVKPPEQRREEKQKKQAQKRRERQKRRMEDARNADIGEKPK